MNNIFDFQMSISNKIVDDKGKVNDRRVYSLSM